MIHDLAGREPFQLQSKKIFFPDATCAILMFDVSRPSSYEVLDHYRKEIHDLVGHIPMVIVGNKIDKKSSEHFDWRSRMKADCYVSAQNGHDLIEPFIRLSFDLADRRMKPSEGETEGI